MDDTQERGELDQSRKKDTDAMEKPESPRADADEKKKGEKVEKLYKALKNIGISNITTLMNRLGLKPKGYARTKDRYIQENAKALLRLMGLDDNDDKVLLLERIGLQGREMLGELSKATITSTPVSTAEAAEPAGRFPEEKK